MKRIFALIIASIALNFTYAQGVIKSKKTTSIAQKQVFSGEWDAIEPVAMPVFAQKVTPPMLDMASIGSVRVRSMNDGINLAIMIEWDDATKDVIVDADKFCDQVAIQFPVTSGGTPSFMMGNKNGKVHIIHWKAVWQQDIEFGFRDVKDAYPNYWTDLYPGQEQVVNFEGAFATDISAAQVSGGKAASSMHGTYSKNPMSIMNRKIPCEEENAEGYGTLETQKYQNATSWGSWNKNTWRVMFVRPITSPDPNDSNLTSGKSKVAFAVWDGNKNNISGRKHYSMWTDLEIQK